MKNLNRLAVLFVVVLALSGCAPKTRHIATVSAVAAHAVLSAVQDTEMALACGKPTSPASCIPVAEHKVISKKLATGFADVSLTAKTIRDWPGTGPMPTTIAGWLTEITTIVNYVVSQLPEGTLKTKLLAQIGSAK